MHDYVLRHWMQDQEAVQNLQAYENIATDQFKTLRGELKKEAGTFNQKIAGSRRLR